MKLNCSIVGSTARLAFTGTAVALAAVTTLALTATTPRSAEAFSNATEAHGAFEAREILRLHAHFDSVLFELSQRDVATLSPTQLAHRGFVLNTLKSYNAAGVFPHNYDFAEPTPYFIDRKTGHLCAFAFLVEATGRRDIVDRVAKMNNNVYVEQLAADSTLTSWFDANGVTLAEGARIQVPYVRSTDSPGASAIGWTAGAGAIGSVASSIWNTTGNRNGRSKAGQVLGLVAGAAAFGGGIASVPYTINEPGMWKASLAGTAIGAVSIGLAARSILHHDQPGTTIASSDDGHKASNTRGGHETRVAPIIPVGRNAASGVSMQIKF